MSTLIPSLSKMYGMLLHLFPREFQLEFREEMENVFAASLEEASKTSGILVVRACLFELFDLPANLVVEHLSHLRKGNLMKNMSFEIGRSKAVLMAALGMMVGWGLMNLAGRNIGPLVHPLGDTGLLLVQTMVFSLPVVLCGLMLGIGAGLERQAFMRIVLWTAVGGILGHLVNLPVRMANSLILSRAATLPQWKSEMVGLFGLLAVMCVYGFFNGAGLGFAFGGWKACVKFALIGLVANAAGILAGYFIATGVGKLAIQSLSDKISYITWCVMGALEGGILGWFFGKGRQPLTDPVAKAGKA
jgi:hypothetical protein